MKTVTPILFYIGFLSIPVDAEVFKARHYLPQHYSLSWGNSSLSINNPSSELKPHILTTPVWQFSITHSEKIPSINKRMLTQSDDEWLPWGQYPKGDQYSSPNITHGRIWIFVANDGNWMLYSTSIEGKQPNWRMHGKSIKNHIEAFRIDKDSNPLLIINDPKSEQFIKVNGSFIGGGSDIEWHEGIPIPPTETSAIVGSIDSQQTHDFELYGDFDIKKPGKLLALRWNYGNNKGVKLRYRPGLNAKTAYGAWSDFKTGESIELHKNARFLQYHLVSTGEQKRDEAWPPDIQLTYMFEGDGDKSARGKPSFLQGTGGTASGGRTPFSSNINPTQITDEDASTNNIEQKKTPNSPKTTDEPAAAQANSQNNASSRASNDESSTNNNTSTSPVASSNGGTITDPISSLNQSNQDEDDNQTQNPNNTQSLSNQNSSQDDNQSPQNSNPTPDVSPSSNQSPSQNNNPDSKTPGENASPPTSPSGQSQPNSQPAAQNAPSSAPNSGANQSSPSPHLSSQPSGSSSAGLNSPNQPRIKKTQNPVSKRSASSRKGNKNTKPQTMEDESNEKVGDADESEKPSQPSETGNKKTTTEDDKKTKSTEGKPSSPGNEGSNTPEQTTSKNTSPHLLMTPGGEEQGGSSGQPEWPSNRTELVEDRVRALNHQNEPTPSSYSGEPPWSSPSGGIPGGIGGLKSSGGAAGPLGGPVIQHPTAESALLSTTKTYQSKSNNTKKWLPVLVLFIISMFWYRKRKKDNKEDEPIDADADGVNSHSPSEQLVGISWKKVVSEVLSHPSKGWEGICYFDHDILDVYFHEDKLISLNKKGEVFQAEMDSFFDLFLDSTTLESEEALSIKHKSPHLNLRSARMAMDENNLYMAGKSKYGRLTSHAYSLKDNVDSPRLKLPKKLNDIEKLKLIDGHLLITSKIKDGVSTWITSCNKKYIKRWQNVYPQGLKDNKILCVSNGPETLVAGVPKEDEENIWIYGMHQNSPNGFHWHPIAKMPYRDEEMFMYADANRCFMLDGDAHNSERRLQVFSRDDNGVFSGKHVSQITLPLRFTIESLEIAKARLVLKGKDRSDGESTPVMLCARLKELLSRTQTAAA